MINRVKRRWLSRDIALRIAASQTYAVDAIDEASRAHYERLQSDQTTGVQVDAVFVATGTKGADSLACHQQRCRR